MLDTSFPTWTAVALLGVVEEAGILELFTLAQCAMVFLSQAWVDRRETYIMQMHTYKNEQRAFLGIAKRQLNLNKNLCRRGMA